MDPSTGELKHADDRLRIAMVITELEIGGAERALAELACGLDPERFTVAVCSIAPWPEPPNALFARLRAQPVEMHSLGCRRPRQLGRAWYRLRSWLRHWQPDVVQSFLFHANVLVGAARGRVPHVLGARVADPRRERLLAERLVARRAAAVVAVSSGVAAQLQRHGFAPHKLITIPNGVLVERFADATAVSRSQSGVADDRRVLLAVGRLDRQKGFDWLLELAPKLLGQLSNHDLVIVGDGPERGSLEQLARRSPPARVHLVGWQPNVPEWLARSDLLLLPSRYEGMPNVVLEAMAASRAVVASRVEGVDELLGAAADVQTAAPGDGDEFLERTVTLLRDEQLLRQTGQANQRRARENFSLEHMVAQYAALYQSLVNPPR